MHNNIISKMIKLYDENIFIGSKNSFKQKKLKWLIEKYFSKIDSLDDLPKLDENTPERGKSFVEIAANKARHISKKYPGYVISSDSGVDIPALGNNWNALKTKRFIKKKNATDFDRMDELLKLMSSKEGSERLVYWKEAIAIAKNGKVIYSTESKSCPMLLQKTYNPKKYKKGIWLCSLFYYPQYKKNYFDLTKEELESDGEDTWWELKDKVESFLNYKKAHIKNNIYSFDLSKFSLDESVLKSLKYNIIISPSTNQFYNKFFKKTLFNKPIISPYHIAAAMVATNENVFTIYPKILLSKITVKISKDSKEAIFYYNDGLKNKKIDLENITYKEIKPLLANHEYLSYISAYLKSLSSNCVVTCSFSNLGQKTNTFCINSRNKKIPFDKFSKIHIKGTLNKENIQKITTSVLMNQKLITQQSQLLDSIKKGEIIISDSIKNSNSIKKPFIKMPR